MDLNEIYIPVEQIDLEIEEKIIAIVDFSSDVTDYEKKEMTISEPKKKTTQPNTAIENVELTRKNTGLF